MALVPAGFFLMGASEGPASAMPEHPVLLDAYYIDLHEVSNAQYQQCVDDGACTPPQRLSAYTRPDYFGSARYAVYPVINVTWLQAQTYCEALGKRLPTEAEWEFAASGPENRVWPWGDTFDIQHVAAAAPDTQPVASFPSGRSPFGVFNMAGNAAEWVADAYIPSFYADSPASNPVAEDPTAPRVYRGGSFGNPDGTTYSTSYRFYKPPSFFDVDIGFRCAASAEAGAATVDTDTALEEQFCLVYLAYKPETQCP